MKHFEELNGLSLLLQQIGDLRVDELDDDASMVGAIADFMLKLVNLFERNAALCKLTIHSSSSIH